MSLTHNLGFPRIGRQRELKRAIESYWNHNIRHSELIKVGKQIRYENWQLQKNACIELIPSNDFSFYDHVLDHIFMLGAIPPRYQKLEIHEELDLYFAMARGLQQDNMDVTAMEMTKWFDTNYHYIVPEFTKQQTFSLMNNKVIDEFKEARDLGFHTKPVMIGPVSFLLLGKEKEEDFHKIDLIDRVLPVYIEILKRLAKEGAEWIQFDEPYLNLDISGYICQIYREAYEKLSEANHGVKILVATYFESLQSNMKLALKLPIQALHIDLIKGHEQIHHIIHNIPEDLILSLGVVDGRNVWKNNYSESCKKIMKVVKEIGIDRVWIGPSCSLLHCPYDVELEDQYNTLNKDIRDWLAFAKQKIFEISDLSKLARFKHYDDKLRAKLRYNKLSNYSRRSSSIVHDKNVRNRIEATILERKRKSPFAIRSIKQKEVFQLPLFPTTTIGSLPQSEELRKWRYDYNAGRISEEAYNNYLKEEIKKGIEFQESIGLDVLVPGELERNDMVEYFAAQLKGISITKFGWVQSYGTRCVRPPIIYGDISRPKDMTVNWTRYAQSLTNKPVKALLTGPMTMVQWSYLRDDQSKYDTALQIALVLSDEVKDLENAGIKIIQIDEPAFREGFPLHKDKQLAYIEGAIRLFRIVSSNVKDETHIHTHMCYSDFTEIMEYLSQLDADVITIETSRSQMELLRSFLHYKYPNDIGPGVFDIHSPRIPSKDEIIRLIKKSAGVLPLEQIWVNPDCGLKTRTWEEAGASLKAMVEAAREMREMTYKK